jgi:hypothetical protein
MFWNVLDIVYVSKIFTFTEDYLDVIDAKEIIRGGTGYSLTSKLPSPIERCYPDYSLYGIQDTAYGYLTRGCPRGCGFCIVRQKEYYITMEINNSALIPHRVSNAVFLEERKQIVNNKEG